MSKRSITKSVIWQLSGKFALQGIAFFTTPIFTRLLTPEDFGYTALYTSWLSIIYLIIGLNVGASIGNARIKFGEEKLPGYCSSIMSIAIISFFIVFLLFIFFGKWISEILKITQPLCILLVIHSFCFFIVNFEIGRLDSLKKVEKSTILSVSFTTSIILSSLLLVLMSDSNRAQSKILGQAIPTILFGLVIIIFIYVRGKKFWTSSYSKYCLLLTLPLIIHSVGHLIFGQSDRIMLQRMIDDRTLGIYSVAQSLCAVLSIIYGALNVSWVPFYYDLKRQNNIGEILIHSRRYLKFFTLVSVGFVMLAYDVFKLMAPPDYYDGMLLIPLFVISHYFSFLYLFPVNHEFFNEKTKLIPIITFFAAVINICINWLLIPRMGLVGAAIGTLSAHFLLFLFHEITARYIVRKLEYKPYIYLPGVLVIIVATILAFLLKNVFFIRWIIAIIIGLYIIRDIIRNHSIF